jgi:hypothetical protein
MLENTSTAIALSIVVEDYMKLLFSYNKAEILCHCKCDYDQFNSDHGKKILINSIPYLVFIRKLYMTRRPRLLFLFLYSAFNTALYVLRLWTLQRQNNQTFTFTGKKSNSHFR